MSAVISKLLDYLINEFINMFVKKGKAAVLA